MTDDPSLNVCLIVMLAWLALAWGSFIWLWWRRERELS